MAEETLLDSAEGTDLKAVGGGEAKVGEPGKGAAEGKTAETGKEGEAIGDAGKTGEADDGDKDGAAKDGEKAAEDALTGAPETYEDFTIPENLSSTPEQLAEFQEFAKELNLSQKGAQKVVEKFAERIESFQEAQKNAWADIQTQWRKETETDEAIGGQKLQASLQLAKTALKTFGNEAFVELVENYGLGNNKAVIQFLTEVGKAASEGGFHLGGNKGPGPKSLAQRLYTQPEEK